MPNIRPIKDLRNTSEISELCHSTGEPIFITKNGYSDMVIMSSETYDRMLAATEITERLARAEDDIRNERVVDGTKFLEKMREKYGYDV